MLWGKLKSFLFFHNIDDKFKNYYHFQCDFLPLGRQIKSNVTTRFIIDTEFGFESYFSNGNNSFCTVKNHFEDFGIYSINVTEKNCSEIVVLKDPERFWFNILFLICIFFVAASIYYVIKSIYKKSLQYFYSSCLTLRELERVKN